MGPYVAALREMGFGDRDLARIRSPLGVIRVPTLYVWGDADDTVGRPAAEWTHEWVSAPYEFAVLHGGGHFTADQMPEQVNALMLKHLARHPL